MARIPLQCSCGWSFFLSDSSHAAKAPCPSCGNAVLIPGRGSGNAVLTPADIARAAAQQQKNYVFVGIATAVIVVVVGLTFFRGGADNKPPVSQTSDEAVLDDEMFLDDDSKPDAETPVAEQPVAPPAPAPAAKPVASTAPPVVEPAAAVSAPPAAAPPIAAPPIAAPPPVAKPEPVEEKVDPAACQREIERLIPLVNMGGVVSEALRFAKLPDNAAPVIERMQQYEAIIQDTLEKVANKGLQVPVPSHMLPGDKITWFSGTDLTKLSPAEAAAFLASWSRRFQAGAMERCDLRRGDQDISVLMYFPLRSKEIQIMAECLKNIGPAPAEVAPDSSIAELSPELINKVKERFSALPEGYRKRLTSEELARMDGLLKGGAAKVFVSEVQFLEIRVLGELIPKFEEEVASAKARIEELKARAMEPVITDVIQFHDGRKMEGVVESESDDGIKIKLKFGSVTAPKSDVKSIERGQGASKEFPDRFKKADGKPAGLLELMSWCKEKRMEVQKEFVAYTLLLLDPANAIVRSELKLGK